MYKDAKRKAYWGKSKHPVLLKHEYHEPEQFHKLQIIQNE